MLQETLMTKEEMMKLKLPGYAPAIATDTTMNNGKRGSLILTSLDTTSIPLIPVSESHVEIIGVEVRKRDKVGFL